MTDFSEDSGSVIANVERRGTSRFSLSNTSSRRLALKGRLGRKRIVLETTGGSGPECVKQLKYRDREEWFANMQALCAKLHAK